MGKDLQRIAEEKTYDILFELENELGLEIGILPEVYYVDENFDLKNIGIEEEYRGYFEKAKKEKSCFTLTPPGSIFATSTQRKKLAEEVGHFMHFNFLNLKYVYQEELFSFCAIKEMLGFFSSKLIDSSRTNPFYKIKDFFPKNSNPKKFKEILIKISSQNSKQFENGFYVQGYSLGEKMFNYYISGKLPKKKIREIFTNPLDSHLETISQFYHWKYEVLK